MDQQQFLLINYQRLLQNKDSIAFQHAKTKEIFYLKQICLQESAPADTTTNPNRIQLKFISNQNNNKLISWTTSTLSTHMNRNAISISNSDCLIQEIITNDILNGTNELTLHALDKLLLPNVSASSSTVQVHHKQSKMSTIQQKIHLLLQSITNTNPSFMEEFLHQTAAIILEQFPELSYGMIGNEPIEYPEPPQIPKRIHMIPSLQQFQNVITTTEEQSFRQIKKQQHIIAAILTADDAEADIDNVLSREVAIQTANYFIQKSATKLSPETLWEAFLSA